MTIDQDWLMTQCEDLILKAERLLGRRDPNWSLGSVRRNPDGDYPRLHVYPERGYADILLSSQLDEGNRTAVRYELAHECLHMLDPCTAKESTNLCEGLAAYFQYKETRQRTKHEKYLPALEAVERQWVRLQGAVRHCRLHAVERKPMHMIGFTDIEPWFLNSSDVEGDLRFLTKAFD
ncbi:MAG: hypothetical protein F4X98_11060 [Gammaproteobacteria bacterium]|nr:hypothetical protein [Gammaproteobacteria bacterium]